MPGLTQLGLRERLEGFSAAYRRDLLDNVVSFWLRHAIDLEHGGFQFCLDRDGTVIDSDKGMWQHGRFTWLLSTLVDQVDRRPEWLETALHGIEFIRDHGFDTDGRAFFQVARDGRPLVKRRYVFAETFHTAAFAAYAKATGDERARDEALRLFDVILHHLDSPGLLVPKVNPDVRSSKGLVIPMILIVTAQVLRQVAHEPEVLTSLIDERIAEIESDFLKEEFRAVLETVGPSGEFLDHFGGRMICPGHALEAGWFILEEARFRGGDKRLVALGTRIIDWMLEWGWDTEFGGITYYRDVKNLPMTEYWHDMKFWWPHNEAIIATLMAFEMTGDAKYLDWHAKIHDWSYRHFPDAEFGEWYGYLHRDGRLSSRLKGNIWKGPFHLPRMLLVGTQTIDRILAKLGEGPSR